MPLDVANYDSQIPDAVRRASERADELARAAGVANVPELPAPVTAEDPPPAPPPVADPPVDPPTPPADEWEQRYLTLQGKYNAEVPSLRSQVGQLQTSIRSMEHLLATLNERTETPAAPAPADPVPTTVVVSKEDEETYGAELVRSARQWARAELAPELARVQNEIAQMRQELAQVRGGQQQLVVEQRRRTILDDLDDDKFLGAPPRDPNALDADGKPFKNLWREVNVNPLFLEWLSQPDPFSGNQRTALLKKWAEEGNVARTAAFFRAFINEHTATTPAPAPPAAHTPNQGTGAPTLADLAAPGRANGAPASSGGAPAERRVWTRAQITALYQAKAAGKYAGREAEFNRLEADAHAASLEGRIR